MLKGNPTRARQVKILLVVLEGEYQPGEAILDVGFGSGLAEEMIFERMPDVPVPGIL